MRNGKRIAEATMLALAAMLSVTGYAADTTETAEEIEVVYYEEQTDIPALENVIEVSNVVEPNSEDIGTKSISYCYTFDTEEDMEKAISEYVAYLTDMEFDVRPVGEDGEEAVLDFALDTTDTEAGTEEETLERYHILKEEEVRAVITSTEGIPTLDIYLMDADESVEEESQAADKETAYKEGDVWIIADKGGSGDADFSYYEIKFTDGELVSVYLEDMEGKGTLSGRTGFEGMTVEEAAASLEKDGYETTITDQEPTLW